MLGGPRTPLIALVLAVLFFSGMVLLAITPIAWHLTGDPPESYPELFFALFGVPFGLLVLVLTGLWYWFAYKRQRARLASGGGT